MEAGEFIESLERENTSEAPVQHVESQHVITLRLTEAEHAILQRVKEQIGQDDSTALRTGLRLLARTAASGDTKAIEEVSRKEVARTSAG